jgi:hypothetical protein
MLPSESTCILRIRSELARSTRVMGLNESKVGRAVVGEGEAVAVLVAAGIGVGVAVGVLVCEGIRIGVAVNLLGTIIVSVGVVGVPTAQAVNKGIARRINRNDRFERGMLASGFQGIERNVFFSNWW